MSINRETNHVSMFFSQLNDGSLNIDLIITFYDVTLIRTIRKSFVCYSYRQVNISTPYLRPILIDPIKFFLHEKSLERVTSSDRHHLISTPGDAALSDDGVNLEGLATLAIHDVRVIKRHM